MELRASDELLKILYDNLSIYMHPIDAIDLACTIIDTRDAEGYPVSQLEEDLSEKIPTISVNKPGWNIELDVEPGRFVLLATRLKILAKLGLSMGFCCRR